MDEVDPVLVEVVRGRLVESRHRGAVVMVDATGRTLLALGDVDLPVLPRSALKPLQALALVSSGAADAFGLTDRHLAIATGSHTGEPIHVRTVLELLHAAGLDAGALACGIQPGRQDAAATNCSGKHAGFLAVARHLGTAIDGYLSPDHPVQLAVRTEIERTCSVRCTGPVVDGCSAPAWALPLRALAHGYAQLAVAGPATPAGRIVAAACAEPWALAGADTFVTAVTAAAAGRAIVKSGAEGVLAAAVGPGGIGIAVKIADGASRAAEVALATVLDRLLPGAGLHQFVRPPVHSFAGEVVGTLRPSLLL